MEAGTSSGRDLKSKHRESLVQMLNFNKPPEETGRADWKVLVYDKSCRDMISPLLNVGDLRKHGVTLHMLISASRDAIQDVAAIYFVDPTEENIRQIAKDVGQRLYDSFHINFSVAAPRAMLEMLAKLTLETDSVRLVSKIFDQSTGFVTLEPTCFSLNMAGSYAALHSPTIKDSAIEALVDEMVMGLFGVIATMGVIPVIRAQPGEAAEMVARKLHAKIQEHLNQRTGLLSNQDYAGFSRPVMVLLDRGMDLPLMLHHPWTYHALAADTLDVRLNHITVESEEQGRTKKKTYDVDSSDPFWEQNAGQIFPKVAERVDAATKQYKADSEEVTRKTGMDPNKGVDGGAMADGNAAKELTAAMSLLPEMQERKRRLDIHTHVATTLLQQIKARDLHTFHKLEQAIIMRQTVDQTELRACLTEGKGRNEDRVRLLLVHYLCSEIPEAHLAEFETILKEGGADLTALQYLRGMKALQGMSSAASAGQPVEAGGKSWWMDKLSSGISSGISQAVKNLIPVGDQLAATRLVEAIMEQKNTPEAEAFVYIDPKARQGATRVTAPFTEAIVFVVGGGNYSEYQNLQDHIATEQTGRTVIYGATELCSADQYLGQLTTLGAESK